MRSPTRLALALLAAVVLAGACSSDDDGGDGVAPLTAESVLTDAAAAMGSVETAAFELSQEGAPVPIDDAGQLLFLAADGRIARPSSADAVLTVDALGFTTEVGAIAIDGTVWFTNPLTGDWTEAPDTFTFDPAVLFDPDEGFAGLLTEVSPTATLVDEEAESDGEDGPDGDGPWRRVEATVSAERVEVLTGGLIGEATTVDAWIDAETDRLSLLRFELPIGDAVSSWRMSISDYGLEVDITPPET